ncbi:probable protein phosphatase 2C 47 [Actinidia eriantha]|uniref:probable protein phosphatase 2C 47 n=1 Tax=Actinidia eriantha TaxID=165200 RepID=UPI0025897CEC|nr:probable protein phosphatase 2C 47 [Actinidia eriantha]XP_057500452.1 probable protein phosphatase 2C 47 [Actinidia eriantha]
MAPGTDTSPYCTVLDGGDCKENVSAMEDEDREASENSGQAKTGKPPRNISVMRHSMSQAMLSGTAELESTVSGSQSPTTEDSRFLPVFRSGSCSEIGPKTYMEDEYICVDNLQEHLGAASGLFSPGAFYGVFDGHGGVDAASFTRKNILNFIVDDSHFPTAVKRAIRNAFVKADHALADAKSLDSSSGTTALTALILGRTLIIANAGDSRAVLGKRGRAIELSKDHKPNCTSERQRIEKLGGVIYDGYLNGQLSVARALGDWHLKGPKGSLYPLSSEPELEEMVLVEEDEFLIMGCDGLWDVMSSQYAVTIVRRELMLHNDPEKCSRVLVREAIKRNTCDNLTVLVVCFSPNAPPRIEVPKSQRRRSISAEGLDLLKGVLSNV